MNREIKTGNWYYALSNINFGIDGDNGHNLRDLGDMTLLFGSILKVFWDSHRDCSVNLLAVPIIALIEEPYSSGWGDKAVS